MTADETLGDLFELDRIRKERTQADQALAIGVSESAVWRWSHDLNVPRGLAVKAIAKGLGFKLDRVIEARRRTAALLTEGARA